MFQRIYLFPALILSLFLSGCGTKDSLVLYKPGETDVWQTSARKLDQATYDRPIVEVKTNYGVFSIELFEKESPVTVENFLQYVSSDFFDNTLFHRVIPGFMIQGGGFDLDLELKPTRDSIENEAGNNIRNLRGTVAMARTNDLDSASSQFFINLVDNPFLDGDGETGGYAVFGRIYDGMEVVDLIAQVETETQKGQADVPVEPVIIESVRRL